MQAEEQHFPVPGRGTRRVRGVRDGGGVAAKACTFAPSASPEAPPGPRPGARPVGG